MLQKPLEISEVPGLSLLPGGPEQRGAEGRTLKRWLVAWHAWHMGIVRDSHLATVTGLVIRRATHHSMAAIQQGNLVFKIANSFKRMLPY